MSKHTIGVWEFERPFMDSFSHSGGHTTTSCNYLVALLNDDVTEQEDSDRIEVYGPNQKANAALIAAAPALLDTLKNLFALVQGEAPTLLENDHHYDMVVDAISRAEGRT